MTCIVALKDDDGKTVWLAGDSAGVAGLSIRDRADRKVFTRKDLLGNEFGFGFTSSFRMGRLKRALAAAQAFSAGVREPFHVIRVSGERGG